MLRALVGTTTRVGALPIARYGGTSLRPVSIPNQRNTLLLLEADRVTLTALPFVARASSSSASRKKRSLHQAAQQSSSGSSSDGAAATSGESKSTSLQGSSGSGETGFTADQPITVVPALAVTRPAFPRMSSCAHSPCPCPSFAYRRFNYNRFWCVHHSWS
jgi:hypothetical protein